MLFNLFLQSPEPINYGTLQSLSKFAPQVLTHHLAQMEISGLIRRKPKGAETLFILTPLSFQLTAAEITNLSQKPRLPRAA